MTFRQLSADAVIDAAIAAGLESIEWGAGTDEHVPVGNAAAAERIGKRTRSAGLTVASLGGYYRARPDDDITSLLDAAEAIGAPRVRTWAGTAGSAHTDDAERARIVSTLGRAADQAAARGIELALEYHGRTLTDTPDSARALLQAIAHPNLSIYWQPTQGAADRTALAELDVVADWVSTLHVFSWWPVAERLRLHERDELWRQVFARAASLPRITDALLEFVPNDDPALLTAETATLRGWLDAGELF